MEVRGKNCTLSRALKSFFLKIRMFLFGRKKIFLTGDLSKMDLRFINPNEAGDPFKILCAPLRLFLLREDKR
jgi:hypothetical protein